ncbi:MAG: tRNA (adenosine(37)-N6)-threonylcarbamoyltransferase complex transferase subunit TsaD [Clostridia bacterium]|nr:tRNA (adenosine(37)-N6)-threonylcarbamoyltransferase complex transferase subunit TsaD [Clostridia bacterium]
MLVLAIESSCDETAAAIVRDGREVLSSVVASQADTHAIYGGVVPEIASRMHIESIFSVVDSCVKQASLHTSDIDAVAVTAAPGLIGALLTGLSFAKAAALALDKPVVPVHHIKGHVAANYIAFPELEPPFFALVISGGHTLFADVRDYDEMEILGSSRDDAAGEAFDKVARVLGLPYPGGKAMDELRALADPKAESYRLPRPEFPDAPLDCSFSGLKTAVINLYHNALQKGVELDRALLSRSFHEAVADVLVPRAINGARACGRNILAVAGGVAANSYIRQRLTQAAEKEGIKLYIPPLSLCGDNAAMIGSAGYYAYLAHGGAEFDLNAYATMSPSETF